MLIQENIPTLTLIVTLSLALTLTLTTILTVALWQHCVPLTLTLILSQHWCPRPPRET